MRRLLRRRQCGQQPRHSAKGADGVANHRAHSNRPRFMRAVFKAAKVARSFLGRKVVTYDGHEAAVSDFSLCFIDGKHRMVTASEDSYLRLWDIDPNL